MSDIRLAHRTDGTGHWLLFDEQRMITGCFCGFIADSDDCGYGDSVLDHFEQIVRAECDGNTMSDKDHKNGR